MYAEQLVFLSVLMFAFIEGFVHITQPELMVLGSLVVMSFILDIASGIIGAKYGGATMKSLMYGVVGLIVGTFVIPISIVGSVTGLFFGIYVNEIQHKKNKKAIRSATYGVVGAVVGSVINLLIAALFIFLFVFFAL